MLKNYEIRKYQMEPEEIKESVREKREELVRQQQVIKEHKLPVFVLIEGWGAVTWRKSRRQENSFFWIPAG